ncbi:transposase [Cytophagaceae bacterium YF14B1]|uniref:Transposase n=1 Tax=Xanthocytophaga flava TaxID=3048013 RepID=A0AAE3QZA3_9BACT|nr:transposase [Xanthocytophaga flavus]MDJ1486275.1 transposase [Xanthocytophaga flavus]
MFIGYFLVLIKKTPFSQSQMIRFLQELESGRAITDSCLKYRIQESTFYNWKKKYGGMQVGASPLRTSLLRCEATA